MCKLKGYKLVLVIALCLMLVGMTFAGLIQNDFGQVEVKEISIDTQVGTLTGYLLVPNEAKTQKLPAIVTSHGYLNNREMQDLNYVELSRRGFVVFAMNAYGHGDSSLVADGKQDTQNAKSGGMIDAVEYLATLPYVDVTRIGVTGHSMGGGYTNTTMNYYSQLEKDALKAGKSASEAKALNKVSAGVIIGNFPANMLSVEQNDGTNGYLQDFAIIGGKFDEFYLGMTGGVFGKDILGSDNLKKVIAVQTGKTVSEDVENGQVFVNDKNGFSVRMYNPSEFHATNHFSPVVVGNMVEFFNETLNPLNPLGRSNQVWWLKELFNLVGLIGLILFVVPFAKLLMATPYFADLNVNEPKMLAPLDGNKQKRKFVISNVSSGVISAIILMPVMAIGYFALITPFFPQDTTGGIGLWAMVSGLIALLFLRINYGKFKSNGEALGFTIGWKKWIKTLILAVAVVSASYGMVFIADYLFQVDFRFWVVVMRIFDASKIVVALKYLPFFLVFFVINSMCLSRNCFMDWSERKQILVSMTFNVIAPLLFVLATYIPVIFTGVTLWGGINNMLIQSAGALIPILTIPFIAILAISAFWNVKLYRATGNIWLGALVNAMLVTLITVANTSFSFMY